MKVLVLGRHQAMMDSVLGVVADAGYDATGVLTDAEAVAALRTGDFDVVTIGGGVEPASRASVKSEAENSGTVALDVFGPDDLLTKLKGLSN